MKIINFIRCRYLPTHICVTVYASVSWTVPILPSCLRLGRDIHNLPWNYKYKTGLQVFSSSCLFFALRQLIPLNDYINISVNNLKLIYIYFLVIFFLIYISLTFSKFIFLFVLKFPLINIDTSVARTFFSFFLGHNSEYV